MRINHILIKMSPHVMKFFTPMWFQIFSVSRFQSGTVPILFFANLGGGLHRANFALNLHRKTETTRWSTIWIVSVAVVRRCSATESIGANGTNDPVRATKEFALYTDSSDVWAIRIRRHGSSRRNIHLLSPIVAWLGWRTNGLWIIFYPHYNFSSLTCDSLMSEKYASNSL